jgi:hypothetical protein
MDSGGFSTQLWIELMWRFLWILMIPVAMTLILLTLTAVAEAVSRAMQDPQHRNKVSTLR